MPLPIVPPLSNNDVSGIININGSNLTPWFDSGQTKALIELLNRYTAEVLLPYVDQAVQNGTAPDPLALALIYDETTSILGLSYEEI